MSRVEWAVGSTPHPGESVLGDAYLVHEFPGGLLLAVVDGVGHGVAAAEVARIVVTVLAANARSPMAALIARCHERLRGTRGATMSVASFDLTRGQMTWAGVGDVAARLVRRNPDGRPKTMHLLVRGGLLGTVMPTLQVQITPVVDGDLVVLATDGVGFGFEEAIARGGHPRDLAQRIIKTYGRKNDDALVLVGRYHGASA